MNSASEAGCTDNNLICHLSGYGLCDKKQDRLLSINETDLVGFFNLPVESPRDITKSAMLCKEHCLNFFHRRNECYICGKPLTSKSRRFSFAENIKKNICPERHEPHSWR